MEAVKKKLSALRDEADAAIERAEAAEAKVKQKQFELDAMEIELNGAIRKNALMETELQTAVDKCAVAERKFAALQAEIEDM